MLYCLLSLAIFSTFADVSDSQGSVNDHESNPSSSNSAQGGTGQVSRRPNTTHEDRQRVFPGNNRELKQRCFFEQRTSTGSENFFLLICLDAIKFVSLSFFTHVETI